MSEEINWLHSFDYDNNYSIDNQVSYAIDLIDINNMFNYKETKLLRGE